MRDKPKSGMSRKMKPKPYKHDDMREDKKLIEKMVKKKDLKDMKYQEQSDGNAQA